MKPISVRGWSILALLILTMVGTTTASGPIAVFALVDNVIFEPNEKTPDRVQVWGTFSVAAAQYSANYSAAQKGYLYYKIDDGRVAQATRAAWADLKKTAGTGEAIGFGGGYSVNVGGGRVRPASEKPKDPDAFPIGNAVTRLGASQGDVVAKLKAAQQAK